MNVDQPRELAKAQAFEEAARAMTASDPDEAAALWRKATECYSAAGAASKATECFAAAYAADVPRIRRMLNGVGLFVATEEGSTVGLRWVLARSDSDNSKPPILSVSSEADAYQEAWRCYCSGDI